MKINMVQLSVSNLCADRERKFSVTQVRMHDTGRLFVAIATIELLCAADIHRLVIIINCTIINSVIIVITEYRHMHNSQK